MTLKGNKGHIPSVVFVKLSFKRVHVQGLVRANENWMCAPANRYPGVNYSNLCL